MKRYYYWALSVVFVGAASFWLLAPHATGQATRGQTTDTAATEDQYQRALEDYTARVKHQEEQEKRAEALLAKEEDFLKRQEEAFKRFEKILETWERQQQEYQRYLDTLPKK